jgi:carboxypeptidase C (cathepsin A)
MKLNASAALAALMAMLLATAAAAADGAPAGDVPTQEARDAADEPSPDVAAASVEELAQPVRRSIRLNGQTLAYTATPGTLTIRDDEGEPTASMFYTAYTVQSRAPRPVTFLFNGGPGSSTVWLHMGSFGPVKVDAALPETVAGPPFTYGPNPDSLLGVTDLVFIDAPTTGLSRALGKSEPKDFFSVDKDIDAFARTIERYIAKYGRWNSPKFIIGESYGTIRGAGLAKTLADKGVQLNGLVLLSTVLNFSDFLGDQSLINFLPTYAANAWYHGKVADRPSLDAWVDEARAFASGPYASALQRGARVSAEEKASVARQMARLTGLSESYILGSNLRVIPDRFQRELLRERGQIIGRIDSRYVGTDADQVGELPSYDAQSTAITGAYFAALNDYLFRDLGFRIPLTYRLNNYAGIGELWDFEHNAPEGPQPIVDMRSDLAAAMRENPRLKVLNIAGLYDLATPFHGADYELDHLSLDPVVAANIRRTYYPAGHMMYTDPGSSRQLTADLIAFYASAL